MVSLPDQDILRTVFGCLITAQTKFRLVLGAIKNSQQLKSFVKINFTLNPKFQPFRLLTEAHSVWRLIIIKLLTTLCFFDTPFFSSSQGRTSISFMVDLLVRKGPVGKAAEMRVAPFTDTHSSLPNVTNLQTKRKKKEKKDIPHFPSFTFHFFGKIFRQNQNQMTRQT